MTVTLMRTQLTNDDVQRLVKGITPDARALAAHKICRKIDRAEILTDQERNAARGVMEYMAKDAAELVRRALSVTLKKSRHLPRDIAVRLANDIDSIACPLLEHSPSLTDEDLIEIVQACPGAKQVAIAGRETVSQPLLSSIIRHGVQDAVAKVAANDGADFTEQNYREVLRRFSDTREVTEAFVNRQELPVWVSEKLVSLISDGALQVLSQKHALPPQLAVELAEGARERATVDLIDQAGRAQDMHRFVQQLHLNGRLSPSLILRGVCLGQMHFFEWALAELAGVPHNKAWLLIHDAGPLGLQAVYDRAGLPQRLFPAFRAAIDVYHETEMGAEDGGERRFAQRMGERLLTRCQTMAREDLDYLIDKLDTLSQPDIYRAAS